MAKKVMFILACHEPALDPRIDWVATSAALRYDTKVVGFQLESRPAPAHEMLHGYAINRLVNRRIASLTLAWWLVRTYLTPGSAGLFRLLELLMKSVATIAMLLVLAASFAVYLVFALISLLNPVRWMALGVRLGRRVLGKMVSPARYLNMRDRWRNLALSLRTRIAQPAARWFPRLTACASRLRYRCQRAQQFSVMLKQLAMANGSLLSVANESTRPDLIYCNDLQTLLAGVLLSAHFRCRLVYDAHEFMACALPDYLWVEAWFWSALERAMVPHVDAAFTVNPLLAAAMSEANGVRFQSLPNCEPTRPGVLPVPDLAKLEPLARGRVRFLFQGNFELHRGIEELISAWPGVDGSRAVLFLRGPHCDVRARCMQIAADLQLLDDSLFFLDPVRETDLVGAAAEADVGIIPYKPICLNNRLACPNKTSQYMHAGVALLTNNLDYVKQLVADFRCGLAYDSDDAQTIVTAVNRLAGDRDLLLTCRHNARIKAVEVFNWEVQSRELFETCERLLHEESPRTESAKAA